ncbi:MAG TPA: acyl-protein synthetase [Bacillota bacterium]|nr:acyl-protein synthetase [Bacillota bacterium]
MSSPLTKEELGTEILAFIEQGLDYNNEEHFNELAINEFVYQFHENEYYRNLCISQQVSPETITHWSDIPALPTEAFKQSIIASFPLADTELSLLTSGTTNPDARGKIYRDKTSLDIIIKCNYLLTKNFIFPDVDKMRILLLVPSPKMAPGMPMAYGLGQAKMVFGTENSQYYITPQGMAVDELISALTEAQGAGEPVALMGATSGFVYFFNVCRERGLKFSLPKGSRICDGGGYQGTFGDCSREQYYQLVEEFLNIPAYMCVNTLGMGESGTNYFDNTLYDYYRGQAQTERHKVDLPWTRTVVVGVRTGKRLPQGEIGLIRHYDLTNLATVLAVQTDNLGYETPGGFEIIGRTASIPGYNLQTPGGMVKDWILGVGTTSPEQKCSTVADGMLRQGHPCSTVADGMLKQGHPCSSVADGMLKQVHK